MRAKKKAVHKTETRLRLLVKKYKLHEKHLAEFNEGALCNSQDFTRRMYLAFVAILQMSELKEEILAEVLK